MIFWFDKEKVNNIEGGKNMLKRVVSLFLIVNIFLFSISLPILADEITLEQLKEYNDQKLRIIFAEQKVGTREEQSGSDPYDSYVYTSDVYENVWLPLSGNQELTMIELLERLGMETEAEEARKREKIGATLFWGGIAASVLGATVTGIAGSNGELDSNKTTIIIGSGVSLLGIATTFIGKKIYELPQMEYQYFRELVDQHNDQLLQNILQR